jgi:hypothetical protein
MEQFKEALKDLTDVCKFEHWLRFYFVRETEDGLLLDIPEEALETIKQSYGSLAELAEKLNQVLITPEISQQTMIAHISKTLDNQKHASNLIPSVLNSKSFEKEMTVFHIWVNAHENQLEQEVYGFRDWMQMFEAWKRTDKGQEMLGNLQSGSSEPDQTTH